MIDEIEKADTIVSNKFNPVLIGFAVIILSDWIDLLEIPPSSIDISFPGINICNVALLRCFIAFLN